MRPIAIALMLLLAAAPAWAINKCVVDGKTVYQDAPCQAGVQAAKVDLSGAGQADFSSTGAQHGRSLVHQAEISRLIRTNRVAVGMTAAEARASWGRPSKVNSSVSTYGTRDQWVYRYSRGRAQYVYLEDGVVTSVSASGE